MQPSASMNWVEDGSGAPLFGIPRLLPPITFRKRLRGALPRSRARGRRAQTRQHTPQAPAEQPRSHAQAPAEDDPQRSHTGSGAHAPAASCPRARRAGQPSIASRKKALSGRVTPLLSKSGCISSPGIPLMLVNLKVANEASVVPCPQLRPTIVACSPRARRAGQPSIASRKKALSGRATALLSKSGCISRLGYP